MCSALVSALVECADCTLQTEIRSFLLGLSGDELQFIADFLGACILEAKGALRCSRAQLAASVAEFQQCHAGGVGWQAEDQQHKMILLLEYLSRSGAREASASVRARHA